MAFATVLLPCATFEYFRPPSEKVFRIALRRCLSRVPAFLLGVLIFGFVLIGQDLGLSRANRWMGAAHASLVLAAPDHGSNHVFALTRPDLGFGTSFFGRWFFCRWARKSQLESFVDFSAELSSVRLLD